MDYRKSRWYKSGYVCPRASMEVRLPVAQGNRTAQSRNRRSTKRSDSRYNSGPSGHHSLGRWPENNDFSTGRFCPPGDSRAISVGGGESWLAPGASITATSLRRTRIYERDETHETPHPARIPKPSTPILYSILEDSDLIPPWLREALVQSVVAGQTRYHNGASEGHVALHERSSEAENMC